MPNPSRSTSPAGMPSPAAFASPAEFFKHAQCCQPAELASPAEYGPADMPQIIEASMLKLMEWLDWRLRQQEDILRNLGSLSVRERGTNQTLIQNQTLESHEVTKQPELAASYAGIESKAHATHILGVVQGQFSAKSDSTLDAQTVHKISKKSDLEARSESSPILPPLLSDDSCTRVDESITESMNSCSLSEEQVWLSNLMDIFDQMDLNQTGSIDITELTQVCKEVDLTTEEARDVFKCIDKSASGSINRMEWLHALSEALEADRGDDCDMKTLKDFLNRILNLVENKGFVFETKRTRPPFLILRHDSLKRMLWDLVMVLLLLYVSVSVPYSLGFGDNKILNTVDRGTDVFFCFDVLLNFRTTFMDRDDTLVVDGCKLAERYLKSWFLLDFIASVPFDLVTEGLLPNLSAGRLLKISKIARVLKLLRLSKIKAVRADNRKLERWQHKLTSRPYYRFYRMSKLASIAFVVAHWLACFGALVDTSGVEGYFEELGENPSAPQKYLACVYWSMTTITTVGYGDITPSSDKERAFAMVAMVIGGSLYGYIIGSVTSIVTDIDVHNHHFQERMELLQSWLDNHLEIPFLLRRRMRRYFKHSLKTRTAMDDRSVVNHLSPELRCDVAFFLVSSHVRLHPMFANISNSGLAELVNVLTRIKAKANEFIVKKGDPGIGMYILIEGLARYDQGHTHGSGRRAGNRFRHIKAGESFGEEIIFALEETYLYTVLSVTDCEFDFISETSFQEHYKNMPELRDQMYEAAVRSRAVPNPLLNDKETLV